MSIIRKEIWITSSRGLVWWAWTKADRVTEWFAPVANVEARVGGAFELFFDPTNRDHMNTAGCVFTSIEPMNSLGFTWKGPDDFADVMNDENNLTTVHVHFSEENGQTLVVVEHSGWGDGEEWDKAKQWHQMAWDQVLGSLRSALESGEGQLCCAPENTKIEDVG